MFCLNDTMRYYLCPGATSMRKGINGLCGVVHEQMGCDVRNGDSVGAITEVLAVAVGGVVAVDIDCVGNAIPSGGGHLGGIAARRDGIPLGRRHNALGEADGHTIVDVLADAIRLGINAKVGAVASVGGGHDHVLGAAAT